MIALRLGSLTRGVLAATLLAAGLATSSPGQDYKLAKLDEAPPADVLAEPIAGSLETTGYRLTRGEDQVFCDLWLCKAWDVPADFEPTNTVLYPFREGQLIGALRFPREGDDFRDQLIPRGVYTLRYLRQPNDGNHVGTSPTSDFVVMVAARDDRSLDPIEGMQLMVLSADASETGHPAVLCLQAPGEKPETTPALAHDEAREWWTATFVGHGKTGEMTKEAVLKVILIGAGMD